MDNFLNDAYWLGCGEGIIIFPDGAAYYLSDLLPDEFIESLEEEGIEE